MVSKNIRELVAWFAENHLAAFIVGLLGIGFTFTLGVAIPLIGLISFSVSAVMLISAMLGLLH